MWITNGNIADVCIVYAKTDLNAKQHGITAFLVETVPLSNILCNLPLEI